MRLSPFFSFNLHFYAPLVKYVFKIRLSEKMWWLTPESETIQGSGHGDGNGLLDAPRTRKDLAEGIFQVETR
jgi:hypothetical protein